MHIFKKYILINCIFYSAMNTFFLHAHGSNLGALYTDKKPDTQRAAIRPTFTNLNDAINAATGKRTREAQENDEDMDLAIAMSLQTMNKNDTNDTEEEFNQILQLSGKLAQYDPSTQTSLENNLSLDDEEISKAFSLALEDSVLDDIGLLIPYTPDEKRVPSAPNPDQLIPSAYNEDRLLQMSFDEQLAYATAQSLEGTDMMGVGRQRMTNAAIATQFLEDPQALPVVNYIKTLKLQRLTTPSDGDCAFHALGITRAEFIKTLQKNIYNYSEEICATVRDNITNQKLVKADLSPQEREKWIQRRDTLNSTASTEGEILEVISDVYSGKSIEYWATSDDIQLISLLFKKNIVLLNLHEDVYIPVNIYSTGDILHLHEEPLMLMQAIDETEHCFEYIHAEGAHYTKLKRG